MTLSLSTSVLVPAPRQAVWDVLADLPSYAAWNPFVLSATGDLAVGSRLAVRLQPQSGRAMTFRPRVTEVVPGQSYAWLGHLGVPGVFDGAHRFDLSDVEGGTLLVQSETFRGVLARPLLALVRTGSLGGFAAMNQALADRVASLASW